MKDQKVFLFCKHCGNLAGMIGYAGTPMICCGEPMKALTANDSDGAVEKHVPVVQQNGLELTVRIGSADHPMIAAHFISWVYLETQHGVQSKQLTPNDPPMAQFTLSQGDVPVAAYAYCNLHGLWKSVAL